MTPEAEQIIASAKCGVLSEKEIGRNIVLLLGELLSQSSSCCDSISDALNNIEDAIDESNDKLDSIVDKLEEIIEAVSE
jgi:hypothetical protein